MQVSRKQDIKEKLIVSVGFVGIFLPVRLVFYTYVSDYWLGSLGIVSVLAFTVTYLSHKDKFGWFGRLWKKQIRQIAQGRLGTFFIISSVLFLSTYVVVLDAMDKGYNHPSYQLMQEIQTPEGLPELDEVDVSLDNLGRAVQTIEQLEPSEFYELLSIAIAVLDNRTDGWLQHFYIVFMVEEVEKLGLMLYFRYFYKTSI